MSTWRLLHSEAVSGELLGELPLLGVDASDELNGAGRFTASMPLDDVDTLATGSTVVYLDRDGVILWSGVVWTAAADYGAGTMTIGGEGLGSYYRKRLITFTTTFSGVEQTAMATNVLSIVEGYGNGLGVVGVPLATGVTRDRTTDANEAKPVGEFIEQLGAVNDGFDIRWRARWDAGVPVRELLFDYPPDGRLLDLVFEVGVNCAVLDYSEDAVDMANYVLGLGAGEGRDKLRRIQSTPVGGTSIPQFDAAVSHLDVTVAGTLDGHVARRLQRGANPVRRVRLQLVPGTVPVPGSFDVGDRVYVRARRGWMNVADYFRIVEISYSYGEQGENVSLTLAGFEAFE